MNALEIIDEIRQLPSTEQAQVARFVRKLGTPWSGEELGELAAKLVGETDDRKVQEITEQLTAGFYGDQPHA